MSELITQLYNLRDTRGLALDEFDTATGLERFRGKRLLGKTGLIIGGSNGIGQATAYLWALQGGKVIVNYHNNTSKVEEMKAWLGDAGIDISQVGFIQADITDEEQIKRLYERAREEFKVGIDIIGLYAAGGAGQKDEDVAKKINYTAQLNLVRIAQELNIFPKQGGILWWVTSDYALNYSGVVDPPHPALADYLTAYHPVAFWKHETGIALAKMQAQLAQAGVRLGILSGPVIPHTSAIDFVQSTDRLRKRRGQPTLFDLLATYYKLASRLDMAAGALDLVTNPDYPPGHILSVTKDYAKRFFPDKI